MGTLCVQRGISENLIGVLIWSDSHILLTEVLDVGVNVGMLELFRERDLLERHAMDASGSGTEQRSCGEDCSLHGSDEEMGILMESRIVV